MKPPAIPLSQVLELAPACLRKEIPHAWADSNGHMNMRWYVAIFDDAGDDLHIRLGLPPIYHREHITGTFDLEHHTHFLSEVIPGDQVAVYARMVDCSAKRIHYLLFLVNETRGKLSAIFECVNGLVDLKIRKTMAYPPEILAGIEAAVKAHSTLDWEAPVCGVMRA
jgi:acyl-CoA thioester hydrolase